MECLREVNLGIPARGERAVVEETLTVGNRGRRDIRIREFGEGWLPWSDAGAAWGATIDTIICEGDRTRAGVARNFPGSKTRTFGEMISGGIHRHWDGILAGVAHGEKWNV